jgi:hypothetical protein
MAPEFLVRFWKSAREFFTVRIREILDTRLARLIVVVTLLVTFAIVFFIVFRSLSRTKAIREEMRREEAFGEQLFDQAARLDISEYIFPEEYNMTDREFYPAREPREKWTREEVDRYWLELTEEDVSGISDINRDMIWSDLEGVP